MVPSDGLDWFRHHAKPEHIYLTNRLHYRGSSRFVGASAAKSDDGAGSAVKKNRTDRTENRFMPAPEFFVECRLFDLVDVTVVEKSLGWCDAHRCASFCFALTGA
jgi:hypothetical protein